MAFWPGDRQRPNELLAAEPPVYMFKGQAAVTTGEGTGLGCGSALAKAGASLYLIRRLHRLELVAANARGFGVEARCCPADISSNSGLAEVTHRIKMTWNALMF
jgi:short-subunit dehydrogenase